VSQIICLRKLAHEDDLSHAPQGERRKSVNRNPLREGKCHLDGFFRAPMPVKKTVRIFAPEFGHLSEKIRFQSCLLLCVLE